MKAINNLLKLFLCIAVHYVAAQQIPQPLEVSINQAIAGSLQEIIYTYTVQEEKITTGGGIRMEYPVAYAETEFLFWSRPQNVAPDFLGYVSAKASNDGEVNVLTYGVAGGIFQCTLKDGILEKGDRMIIHYKGLVQSLARDFTVRAEVRSDQNDEWQKITNPPVIKIIPQEAKTLILTSPADISIGQPFDLAIVVLDQFGNLASGYRGNINFQSTDQTAILPERYTFTDLDQGKHVFKDLVYNTPGFQKTTVVTNDALKISSHYSYNSTTQLEFKRYFGDTHFHTGSGTLNKGFFGIEPVTHDHPNRDVNTLSLKDFQRLNSGGDHRGNFTTAPEAYSYAKEVVQLDFASASEHDVSLFDQNAWDYSQHVSDSFYQPGQFTTFFAYEWTPGITHHIIMYKERGLQVFDRRKHPDLPSLWDAFDQQNKPVLCIPHLTWNFEEHTNWDHINNTYRRLGEIYSLWNGRYLIQPGDEPQRFELGKDNKWTFQHAWHRGHRIGIIGSTDNHLGRPGANNYTIYTQHTGGLAVAIAKENNRDRLWDALEKRRTYATTGTRIYLGFTVNGHSMGSEIKSKRNPTITAKVAGTNKLEVVEVVKYTAGEYSILYQVAPDADTTEFQIEDRDFNSDCFYYLRIAQVSEVPGRLWTFPTNEMAWSSPVWVEISR